MSLMPPFTRNIVNHNCFFMRTPNFSDREHLPFAAACSAAVHIIKVSA